MLLACFVALAGQAGADPTQTLTVDGVTVDEAAGTATFVVKLSAGPDNATFDYATADGSAKAGSDYTAKSGTALEVTGGGQVTISVDVANDDLFEGTQSFSLNITGIAKAANTTASATANITDNDPAPVVSVTPTSANVAEGSPAAVTLSLANKSEAAVTVNFEKQNQTAGDADYALTAGSRTWASGETGDKPAIQATTTQDALDEPDETFRITFSSSAQLSNAFAQVTITDDDDPPLVQTFLDAEVTEDNTTVNLHVVLSAPSGKRITIDYGPGEGGTATAGMDYTAPNGQLEFLPGQTDRPIPVVIKEDTLAESDETLFVNLFGHANVSPGAVAETQAKVTIKDDGDAAAAPTISSPAPFEGNPPSADNPGFTDLVFEVTLASPRPETRFNYRTVAGTADGTDFVEVGGSQIVFPANPGGASTKQNITIKIKRDLLDENDETLKLELLNPTTEAKVAEATGTIKNDDNNSKLSINDATADEPGTMKFTVTLAPASGREVKVNYASADGTATAPGDYTAASGQLTFAPGETAKTIELAIAGDTLNEENETLGVTLSGQTGVSAANLIDAEGAGTIVDKNAPPTLSISDTTGREGEGANFTVTLAGTTLRTVTVRFNTADGTAKAGSDYSARTGTLTFAPGEKTKTIAVTVLDDTVSEPVEEFAVIIGDAVNATITKTRGEASIEASDRSLDPVGTPTNQPTTQPKPNAPKAQLVPRMILGPRTVNVGVNGLAKMQVNCQRVSPIVCAGSVELQRAAKPLLKLGTKSFSVKKGQKAFASIKLTPRALKLLKKNKTMRVKVIVLVKTSTKTLKVSPGVITLKATPGLIKAKLKPAAPPPPQVVVDP